jgi:hypothetical protein
MPSAPKLGDALVRQAALPSSDKISLRQKAIVRRWLDYAGAEAMWSEISRAALRHSGSMQPETLIKAVFSAAWRLESLIEFDRSIRTKFEKLKTEAINLIKAADHPYDLCRTFADYQERALALHRSSYDFHSTPVSRKSQGGSRDRIYFAQRMGEFFAVRCGEPRDREVAELTAIVFDLPNGTSIDQVRLARRPSTKAARKRRI